MRQPPQIDRSRILTFTHLLKLWDGPTLWYTFPVHSKKAAAFLAGPWLKLKSNPRSRNYRATIVPMTMEIPRGWLLKVDFNRGPDAKVLYALGVPQARLWNEWFEGLNVTLPRSTAKPKPWVVTFVDTRTGRYDDDIPF